MRPEERRAIEWDVPLLDGYGINPDTWPPASVVLILSGISRFLLIEEAFDVDIGHADTATLQADATLLRTELRQRGLERT